MASLSRRTLIEGASQWGVSRWSTSKDSIVTPHTLVPVLDIAQQVNKTRLVAEHKSLRRVLQVDEAGSCRHANPWVVGHRGALYSELENTRQGFLECANMGCQAVELDVFCLRDGTLVVFHGGGTDQEPGDLTDYIVEETITGSRCITDLTFDETQRLVFNTQFAEFGAPADKIQSAVIPKLEDVLMDLKPYDIHVKVELKGDKTALASLALAERLGMIDRVSFSSFNHAYLLEIRQSRPERNNEGKHIVQTGALFDNVPNKFIEEAMACGASQVHLRYDTCTVDRVKAMHEAGLGSMAWFRGPRGMKRDTTMLYHDIGNENAECYEVVWDTGVQQLCCNRPDLALQVMREWQEQNAGTA
jgi:glycerophosphoryl diester phosphodiesterase